MLDKKNIIFLVIGLGIGGAIGWVGCKKRYEEVVNEEIDSMKEHFEKKYIQFVNEIEEETKKEKEQEQVKEEKPEEPDYQGIIKKLNYNQFSTKSTKPVVEDKEPEMTLETSKPRLITQDEFIDNNGYEKVVLSYFEDDEILMDATDNVLENGIMIIGEENLQEFGIIEEEEDTIYVRNDLMGCDYEVVMENGSYADYIASEV